MAISRGAGTEIIRTAIFEEINNSPNQDLIIGEQHHIYTVLSITLFFDAIGGSTTAEAGGGIVLVGYDSYAGTSGETIKVAVTTGASANDTFVWNDKFSFNGCEPADFASGGLTTTADQDKLADQGTTTAQKLQVYSGHSGTLMDVTVTYIDQNNS